MNKQGLILLVIGIIVVGGGIFLFTSKPSTDTNTPPSTPPGAQSDVKVISVSFKNGEATPQTLQVMQGEKVRIEGISDIAGEMHFHGYDIEKELEPNVMGVIEFTADQTGRFDIELHHDVNGKEEHSALGVIEVYPR